jgi:hypothetical protein
MGKINNNNYEAYFLDFIEGNLSASDLKELEQFLAMHPELKADLEAFELVELPEAPSSLEKASFKEELLREESTGLLEKDYLMLAQVEGVITEQEKQRLALLIKKEPDLLNDLAFYHKTVLPKEELVFEEKEALLRKDKRLIVLWRSVASVAAAILLMVFLGRLGVKEQYQTHAFSWGANTSFEVEEEQYAFTIQKEALEGQEEVIVVKDKAEKKSFKKEERTESLASNVQKKQEGVKKQEKGRNERIPNEEVYEDLLTEAVDSQETEEEVQLPEQSELLAENTQVESEGDFIPIKEFARKAIQKEVVRGKTFSEGIMEELAAVAKDKLELETEKDEEGKMQSFALNIGKLKISRNK